MAKKKTDYNNSTGGAIMIVAGILILVFPNILQTAIGLTLMVLGILALTKNK